MSSLLPHTDRFVDVTAQTIHDVFGIKAVSSEPSVETPTLQTDKSLLVTVQYTGSVYGEYVLAMDEETAARLLGMDETIDDDNRDSVREDIGDALSETLNLIVGTSIVDLQKSHSKLTLTAPRLIFGNVRYPAFKTARGVLGTPAGPIECHFCLDRMRLDLATSYDEAMDSLLEVNDNLRQANERLAQQQAQLVHTEKMASVGILASGVAHEINNPLFFVDSNLHTLDDYVEILKSTLDLYNKLSQSVLDEDGRWIEQMDAIRNENDDQDLEFVLDDTKHLMEETRLGVRRIKAIVQSLKDFSQVDRGGMTQADLNLVVENTLLLIGKELPSRCEIETHLETLPPLVCNIAEIGQVVAGLILNAAQAIPNEGTITVHSGLEDEHVLIRVTDDGCGIESEHLDHLFEPFYSTKPEGDHPGLGLSIAYGIVQKHAGSINFQSKPGVGTEVTMRLPLARQLASA
ncbi:MAG: ATP-binding protein [Planctomycetota bacterium]